VAGEHEGTAGGLLPCGHRKDAPTRPPSTVRRGALAPVGRPLATEGGAGERAEDGFYLPSLERLRTGWQTPGLWCVGAGPRSAWDTRASRAGPQDCYGAPLPLTGAPAGAMAAWITVGVTQGEAGQGTPIWRPKDRGHEGLAAEGSEGERTCRAPGSVEAGRERGGAGARPYRRPNRARGGQHVGVMPRPH
jgi:hypothetical protein